MEKKFQIFVSSTYEDLKDERDQVIKAILEMGHIPVGMEMFSAADEEQWKIIQRQIDESDYYVVIAAHKYGSIAADGVSYTEKEYDYAVKKSVPALGFVLADGANWPANQMESSTEKREALEQFKSKIKSRIVNFWTTKDDLHAKVSISLMKSMQTTPRIGWVRANTVNASPELVSELTRLSKENATLRGELEDIANLAKQNEKKEEVNTKAFEVLRKNIVEIYIAKIGDTKWGEPKEGSLLGVFKAIAPNLMVENTFEKIGADIAVYYGEVNHRQIAPVPNNILSDWLADLAALNLIKPSPRKHPVSDKNEYWTLSEEGSSLLRDIRKIQLEKGLVEHEAPES
ncbi:DUF4062 domain-containing protein [Vibrio diabolicus]|uniref:DUF4062 domain-containing protein n=1 Tax=Vibrio TaxID=662 RepID=UPI00215F0008|nr:MULTISPECIES: DUF4062 domain-containing protein [Vibrio]MCS0444642.1 DUF4062 domain-containing protein [Vibrio diabolicus]MDW1826583.1 DUF4062 domain-containing protein [Vibrio sp. Vb0937]MDW3188277.1 DUF4062 domain-containing protein [Vibrio sp. Vb0932]